MRKFKDARESDGEIDSKGAFVCGAASGVIAKLLDFPLDTIKTRMQLQGAHKNVATCATHIWSSEGILGFYAGIPAPLVACALCTAVGFSGFNTGVKVYDEVCGNVPNGEFIPERVAAGGFTAGIAKAVVTTPFELVKCRVQAQPLRWRGVAHCAKDTLRVGGIRSLFKGHGPNTLRETIGNALWFGYYEGAMTYAAGGRARSTVSPFTACAIAGTSGIVYWTFTMPIDTVKTRIQVDGHVWGASQTLPSMFQIVRHEGCGALYRGYRATIYRTVPASAILFSTYEAFTRQWRAYEAIPSVLTLASQQADGPREASCTA